MVQFGIGILITIIILYIILLNKFKKLKQKYFELNNNIYNEEKEKREERIKKDTEFLYERFKEIDGHCKSSVQKLEQLNREITEKTNFNDNLKKIREEELNRLFEEKKKEKEKILIEQMARREEELHRGLREQLEFWTNQTEEEKIKLQKQIEEVLNELNEYKQKRDAINEAIRLEEEIKKGLDAHRIILSDTDKQDIELLLNIETKINNKQTIRKLIWTEYLQKPFNQMLNNIFGANVPKNVIYCIENIETHKKYIGKTSAEVSKRWTEHIKTSLNIGTIKSQIIHTSLFKNWDKYCFSIICKTDKENLSEREKYYISFYETDKYGYNMKGGG